MESSEEWVFQPSGGMVATMIERAVSMAADDDGFDFSAPDGFFHLESDIYQAMKMAIFHPGGILAQILAMSKGKRSVLCVGASMLNAYFTAAGGWKADSGEASSKGAFALD